MTAFVHYRQGGFEAVGNVLKVYAPEADTQITLVVEGDGVDGRVYVYRERDLVFRIELQF